MKASSPSATCPTFLGGTGKSAALQLALAGESFHICYSHILLPRRSRLKRATQADFGTGVSSHIEKGTNLSVPSDQARLRCSSRSAVLCGTNTISVCLSSLFLALVLVVVVIPDQTTFPTRSLLHTHWIPMHSGLPPRSYKRSN